jgi:hypothetical protein
MTRDDFICSTANPFPLLDRRTGRAVDRTVAIPIRWFVPLLLISVAGAFSAAALVKERLNVGTRQHFNVTVAKSPYHSMTSGQNAKWPGYVNHSATSKRRGSTLSGLLQPRLLRFRN